MKGADTSDPLFCLASRRTVHAHELGPDAVPVVGTQVPAADCAGCFTLQSDGQFGRSRPQAVGDVLEVATGGAALGRQRIPVGHRQEGEVVFEVHAAITPHGVAKVNTVRCSPLMSTRAMDEEGQARIDRLIQWCLDHGLATSENGKRVVPKAFADLMASKEVKGRDSYWMGVLDKAGRSFGAKKAREVEQALQMPPFFLDGAPQESAARAARASSPGVDLDAGLQPAGKTKPIPLISWVTAGNWLDVQDPYPPGEPRHWQDVYSARVGEHAFALRVVGDSMTNPIPGGDTFPEGSVLIVDPSRRVDAGDYVIAKDVSTQKATFKKLVSDGGRWFLKPLNPSYPTVEIDDPDIRIIGRVMESIYSAKF